MKSTLILFLFFLYSNFSNGQSKKKQIIKLKFQIDSLINSHNDLISEKELTIKRLNSELFQKNQDINKLNLENSNYTDEISILKKKIISEEDKLKDLVQLYNNLKHKNFNDSIQILSLKQKNEEKKITVKNIDDLKGIYHGYDSYKLLMPTFVDIIGPKYLIKIYEDSEFRYDVNNSTDLNYYITFENAEDYSGQEPINNHMSASAKIIDFKINNDRVVLTLITVGCLEYFDGNWPLDEDSKDLTKISQKFEIEIQLLENEKIKVFSKNAPKLCNEAWNLNGIEFFHLNWSNSFDE